MNNITKYTLENCKVCVESKQYTGQVIVNSMTNNGIEFLLECEQLYKSSMSTINKPFKLTEVTAIISKGTITNTEIIGTHTKITINDLVENL